MKTVLGIFVKLPIPGHVKTRLGREIGMDSAAEFAAAFQEDLLLRTWGVADRRVVVCDPGTAETIARYQANLPSGDECRGQGAGNLGDRLRRFFADSLREEARTVVIGSDSPNLPISLIQKAFEGLRTVDFVFGPATDGGYYLVGQRRSVPEIFDGIPWSTAGVMQETLRVVGGLGATCELLPPWYDIDCLADLRRLRSDLIADAKIQKPIPAATWNQLQRVFPVVEE